MKIGIDARVLEKKMTGIGRVLLEILKYAPSEDPKNEYFLFAYDAVSVGNSFFHSVTTLPAGKTSKLFSPMWLLRTLPRYLKKYDINVYFTPNAFAPLRMRGTKWKSIIILHDTFNKVNTGYHPFAYKMYLNVMIPVSLRQSTAIVTGSEHAKTDICRFYGTDPTKITVIYHSADARFTPRSIEGRECETVRSLTGVKGRFILFIGKIERRKNIGVIIRVADMLKARGVDAPVVLVGQPGNGAEEFIQEIRKRENMRYLPYLDDELLPYIYNMASVFFFPSLYEGFGLPPLEAMQSGTPVVSSNSSSLPEVIGEAGIMLDPNDDAGYADAIVHLLEDSEYHDRLRKKGIEQAKLFDAKAIAKQYIRVFNSIVSN